MKTKIEYRKELAEAMHNGNRQRARDIKDILQGKAIEPTSFIDLLKAADCNLRIIQTSYTKEFREQFCNK